jgi:hypothetical protein
MYHILNIVCTLLLMYVERNTEIEGTEYMQTVTLPPFFVKQDAWPPGICKPYKEPRN